MTAAAHQLTLDFQRSTRSDLAVGLGCWYFNPEELRQRLLNAVDVPELDARWDEAGSAVTAADWPLLTVIPLQDAYLARRAQLEAA